MARASQERDQRAERMRWVPKMGKQGRKEEKERRGEERKRRREQRRGDSHHAMKRYDCYSSRENLRDSDLCFGPDPGDPSIRWCLVFPAGVEMAWGRSDHPRFSTVTLFVSTRELSSRDEVENQSYQLS